tara:strand:+ start:24353 stop:25300 length:948 start_codon:yes stop_codon:yes gene_type:complete
MILTRNQFYGLDIAKNARAIPGSTYVAIDTKKIYIYDNEGIPRAVNGSVAGSGNYIVVEVYTELPVGVDPDTIAFVINSQGTKWLPGTLGGTYYPPGWYIYKTGVWRHSRELVDQELENVNSLISENTTSIDDHKLRLDNPHSVTKTQVGLDQVNNTSDIDKPISNATITALSGKSNIGHTHIKANITDFNESDYASGAEGDLAATSVQPGDNVSDLLNNVNYTVVGSNVSQFVNDEVYLQPSDNISALNNDSGYIIGNTLASYRSDVEVSDIYSGYLLNTTPIIKKYNNGVETFAQGVTNLEPDWTNRLNLTYI